MRLKPHHMLYIVIWAIGTGGLLWLGNSNIFEAHNLCGPWGCFPSLSAVAALHGLWIWALVPLAIWLIATVGGRRLRWLGLGFVVLSLLGVGLVILRDNLGAGSFSGEILRTYPVRRTLFLLAVLTDVPLVQSMLLGGILLIASVLKRNRGQLCSLQSREEPTGAAP